MPPSTATPDPLAGLFPYTVTDSNGNEVTFEGPPERIVAFDSAVVETLFAIGEGHRVVGTHDFVSHPAEAADIPRLGGAFNMNMEATVVLEPDLVFIFYDGSLADLEKVGLKVLYQKSLSADFRSVADNIRMWGRIIGSPEAAETVAAQFEARVARVEEVMATLEGGLTVFQDEGQLWTPGSDTLMGEVFELLKLQNIAYDVSGYAQLSPEIIVERDPAVVIASYGDTISDNPAFQNLTAVKSGRVLVPQSDALSIAGPRFIDGIEDLASWLYPDLFD
jgi:iron complex transport system substrate-binding protein